jgi:hypothetical protein
MRSRGAIILLGLVGLVLAITAIAKVPTPGASASTPAAAAVRPTTRATHPDRILLTDADVAAASGSGLLWPGARSILGIDTPLRHGEFVWNEKGAPRGEVIVLIDLRSQLLSVFRDGHEIGAAVILYGAEGHDSPLGAHPVLAKSREHVSRTYGAPMPYSLWLTKDGAAIHGSEVRTGAATHGCIGVPVEFAAKLFAEIEVGDMVRIVESAVPSSGVLPV